jgi:hypothetical protein
MVISYLRNFAWSRPNPKLICLLQGLTLPAVADLPLVGIVMVDSLLPIKLDAPLQATVSLVVEIVVVGPPQMVLVLLVRFVVRLGTWL